MQRHRLQISLLCFGLLACTVQAQSGSGSPTPPTTSTSPTTSTAPVRKQGEQGNQSEQGKQGTQLPQSPTNPLEESSRDAMKNLAERIREKSAERDKLARELNDARRTQDEAKRASTDKALQAVDRELDALRLQFASIASEADIDTLESQQRAVFDLNSELVRVVRPLVEELKDATETPREIERLKSDLEVLRRSRETAEAAIRRIDSRIADPTHRDWLPELRVAHRRVLSRLQEIRGREAVARQQLAQREATRKSFLDSSTALLREFFGSRSMNLLIGLGALLGVFLVLRFLQSLLAKLKFLRSPKRLSFAARLFEVVFGAVIVLLSVSAMLLAFYAVNDWLLLLASLVFILGVGWASLRVLPMVFEQIRMLLNLGSVREGERIVRNGIPWRVQRLQLYTYLVNPKLSGGLLRLPVRDLIGLHSRPIASGEVWFPTSRGDWVILSDGTRAEVISQTPDFVQLQELGGATHTCKTEDFIGMKPRNLSTDFRISQTFGVDYGHQAICTTEIPRIMEARLRSEITEMVGAENLFGLRVEFKEAGASSLDYEVLADFSGAMGRDHSRLKRAVARILVDACNEHGWTIPFTQLTLHHADTASA